MKRIIFLCISLSLLLFWGCAKTVVPIFGNLHGTVVDEDTSTPMQGVTITLSPGGNSTITGANGRYEFNELESKQYSVTATQNGFQPDMKSFTVIPGQTVIGDFSLRKGVASLVTDPSYLNFGTTHSQLAFDLRNIGTLATTYTITLPSGGWCEVSEQSGTLAANNGTVGVLVTINRSMLTSSKQENIIIMSDKAGSQSVTINVDMGDSPSGGIAVSNGLWAYYTFDDETMNDSGENRMNGTIDFTPTFTTTTPNGKGKSLVVGTNSDNNWVMARVPYNPFKNRTEYSYCLWVKNPSQGMLMNTYGNSTNSSSANYPTMRIYNNKLYAGFSWGSTSEYFDYNTSTTISNGEWNHIAVSVKDYEQILYINGQRVSTQQEDVDASESSEIHFGGSLGSISGADMRIDNIRLYSRTITQRDAREIYNSEK